MYRPKMKKAICKKLFRSFKVKKRTPMDLVSNERRYSYSVLSILH